MLQYKTKTPLLLIFLYICSYFVFQPVKQEEKSVLRSILFRVKRTSKLLFGQWKYVHANLYVLRKIDSLVESLLTYLWNFKKKKIKTI